ncbi:hypothetical protein GHT06_021782 [Daphnia sinensis]|uniref:Uncharacterized protein n=1 Tax=Daphnia sinensis TaxID=1820382 RepID=A0AAD5KGE7_9CRUS|nr:hypothetical protein GHT06_021782 [Daphnia sinensis]
MKLCLFIVFIQSRMSTVDENISEIVNVLSLVSCPLIVRSDDWWIEELLFTPGKPRTDLILWITSKAIESSLPSNLRLQLKLQDLDCSAAPACSTSILKFPETDEAVLGFWCGAYVCTKKDLPFIKGDMPKNLQIKYWIRLIKTLEVITKSHVNTNLAFGVGLMNNIVSMDNFLDAFSMKASLLSADVQSEIKQMPKERSEEWCTKKQSAPGRNLQNDKLLIHNFLEQANRLNLAADQFSDVFKADLNVCLPKSKTSDPVIEFGDEISVLSTKLAAWKKGMDSLLELQQSNASEVNLKKSENLLKRSVSNESFVRFQKLWGSD